MAQQIQDGLEALRRMAANEHDAAIKELANALTRVTERRQKMHLPLLKALIAVISASVLAIGVALASTADPHPAHSLAATTTARTLETDGLQFLGLLAAGNVKPHSALKQSWIDDVTAVAHSLALSDRALARQISAGRSLAQIAASRGVPTSMPRSVLLRRLRDDLHRAEQDHALSPAAANSLIDALGSALGSS